MIVANLWAKQLIEGDIIVKVALRDHYRYGPIKRFDVERTEAAHAAEQARELAEQQALEAEAADR